MRRSIVSHRHWSLLLALAVLVLGCAPAPPPSQGSGPASNTGQPQPPAAPKQITVAMMGNPVAASDRFVGGRSGGGIPGASELEQLVGGALTPGKDNNSAFVPQLAEAVPTFENGLWKVLPDGRMETTWRIRAGARWHDGVALTSADVLFTTKVEQDRDLPVAPTAGYEQIASIEAPDAQTVTITWKRPYIQADQFFLRAPLPQHILERPYTESKESFTALAYWNEEYVGAGPYRVGEWVRDSHATLHAFDDFVLGRPKIDDVVVKFLADENAFMANILAGTVDASIGKSINYEQATQIRTQWSDGKIVTRPETVVKLWPQFLDPNPAIMLNVQFRKALFYAIDRQELVDSLVGRDASAVAHSVLLPTEPLFDQGEATAVKYEYDPRRATTMIEQLGYTRGADGLFRDSRNELLSVEIQATGEAQNTKPSFAIANYWKQIGVDAQVAVVPIQLQNDRKYRAEFPGLNLQGSTSGIPKIGELTSTQSRLPENNYNGRNYPRYMNQEFDGLVATLFASVPLQERGLALQRAIQWMTDQVVMYSLYYAPEATMISNRMVNAGFNPTWNASEWDLK
ncbi:MAG: peptide/nickel transport system substrate-binding protein [Chloroflexota bacterium]|jgi:peptide/nickel transport system substrate-binding protein|nr:peptide/nickel transport system substrate-binding protein [Chloroflexota bacterium]